MKRHFLSTRLWHWTNAAAVIVLFMSGLNISNAHRYLYWGDYGFDPAEAWTRVARFPGWATLPQYYDLAAARDWHNTAAWVFALALLAIWLTMIANGHFRRDIATRSREWHPGALAAELAAHLRLQFDPKDGRYNPLQRIAYGLVYGALLPLMVFTGLAISPGFEPAAPWLVDLLGGRQSARSIHFITAWGLAAFLAIHLVMVIVTGPVSQVRDMITGGRMEGRDNG